MKMKKYTALLLASAMSLSLLAGCGGGNDDPSVSSNPEESKSPATNVAAEYTYNSAISTWPASWNYHTYQTATASDIIAYISDGFYTFDFNETMDGYQMVPSMVTGDPVDVTADYIGKYGLEEGATERAWKYTLKDTLAWDDGTPITAQDFVDSAERLLNPVAQNYRADSLYASSFVMHNAEAYLKNGRTTLTDNMPNKDAGVYTYQVSDLVKGADGTYTTPEGEPVYVAVYEGLTWLDGDALGDYTEGGYDAYFNMEHWEELAAAANDDGVAPLTDDTLAWITSVISTEAWGEDESNVPGYLVYDHENPTMDFSEVGIFALSDTELVIVIDQPLSGFYLKYYIGGEWLVKIDLYDACSTIDADGNYSNTYCTSAETTASYGPYSLTSYQLDKQFEFTKNENWHTFKEGIPEDQYQTTRVVVDYVAESSALKELFLQGKLSSYTLEADDMQTYQSSDNTYYASSAACFGLVVNPGLTQLEEKQKNAGENINKTILTVKEFRQALSYGLDRQAFILATSPTNNVSLALYSNLNIYDPESGATYRGTDEAKQVVADFWGVSDDIGDGKMYSDIDEAIDSITGYNLDMAKQKFDEAYDIAIAEGLMDEDDIIQITIGIPAERDFYNNGYEFLVNNYTEAVKGTKLEGKLTFNKDNTIGNAFGDALRNNQVDMLFGVGFSGSALDPFNLWAVYVTPQYTYDANTDYSKVDVSVTLTDGVTYTTDAVSWYEIMAGRTHTITAADGSTKEFSCGSADNDPANRLKILAASEGVVLQNYNYLPLMDNSSALLKSMKIKYPVEEYVFGVGFGGLQYYTYNYTDAEWDSFVASQGGILDYT